MCVHIQVTGRILGERSSSGRSQCGANRPVHIEQNHSTIKSTLFIRDALGYTKGMETKYR